MHFERRVVHEEPRSDELVVHVVFAEYVADVLTQITLDALPELLNPVDIGLVHLPGTVLEVGWARLERLDAFLDLVVPRDVGDEILHERERLHGLHRDRAIRGKVAHAGHAHELRLSVDLGGARAALARFTVPTNGQIVGLLGLDLMDGVQHDHPLGELGRVLFELPARGVAAPDLQRRGRHQPCSSMIF